MELVGIVLITHGDFGHGLLATAQSILGECEQCLAIGVNDQKSMGEVITDLEEAIQKVDSGQGVLVCTDMFGGTPSNISLSLLTSHSIEVVCGVNLPMLLSILPARLGAGLAQLASDARKGGQDGIVIAGEILRRKVEK